MKNQLIALMLLLTISMATLARNPVRTSLTTRIADDSNTLTIQIDSQKNGHTMHYLHSFDVAGMNWLQKDWLKYRVFAGKNVMLPFHEMRNLAVAAVGLLVLLSTLFLIGYRLRKSSLANQ